MLEIAVDTPPVDNKLSRFGNPSFKTFFDKVAEVSCKACLRMLIWLTLHQSSTKLHRSIPGLPEAAIPEVETYFRHAWGNRERVDYGSGMELNFLSWL